MEQLSRCHGDHSVAQRLEASSLTTPSLASIPGRVFAFITVSCSPNRYKSENSAWDRGYTITYWRVGSNAANAGTITVSGEDASSAIIINLDPNSDYYFTVSAGTVQGVGNVSVAMVIPTQSGNQRRFQHIMYLNSAC